MQEAAFSSPMARDGFCFCLLRRRGLSWVSQLAVVSLACACASDARLGNTPKSVPGAEAAGICGWQPSHMSPLFHGEPPQIRSKGRDVPYHPEFISVFANLSSRHPQLPPHVTTTVQLVAPASAPQGACSGPFRIYLTRYRRAAASPPKEVLAGVPVMIMIPGSFSHWHSGGHSRKIIELLAAQVGDFYVVGLDGTLSQSFLRHSCSAIPWDAKSLAEDLYQRLETWLMDLGIQLAQTALVGVSGGGAIGAHMLGYATRQAEPMFQQGALLISPVLNSDFTFATIDAKVEQIPHQRVLEDPMYLRNLIVPLAQRLIWRGAFGIDPVDLIQTFRRSPQEFTERFYNQFIYVHLKEVLEAVKLKQLHPRLGFRKVFQQVAPQLAGRAEPLKAFQQAHDLAHSLRAITTKTWLHFPLDDPLLSDYHFKDSVIRQLFAQVAHHPHLCLYTPPYGAHIGAFIDPQLPELLAAVFKFTRKTSSVSHDGL